MRNSHAFGFMTATLLTQLSGRERHISDKKSLEEKNYQRSWVTIVKATQQGDTFILVVLAAQ